MDESSRDNTLFSDLDFSPFGIEPDTISPGILQTSAAPPKIGNRFSSESVKILRNWFAAHERHPYPSIQDVQDLQEQTGLNRQQVTNWFANARRRVKVHLSRPTSPMFRNDDSGNSSGHHTPIDTPRRRPTPAPFEAMNPLQRWANSPRNMKLLPWTTFLALWRLLEDRVVQGATVRRLAAEEHQYQVMILDPIVLPIQGSRRLYSTFSNVTAADDVQR
ncbi:hypothetical protein NXS19_014353 [Fusarium pseudograminearum]|nr:hypothetical protein NXS19_014353 [Fusarium pseudograminearum]